MLQICVDLCAVVSDRSLCVADLRNSVLCYVRCGRSVCAAGWRLEVSENSSHQSEISYEFDGD